MKVTRSTTKRKANAQQVSKPKYRPAKRYINPANQIAYTELLDNTFNNPQTFTYMDFARNQNMINVFRKQYEDIIRLYRN
jgi:hypothetical protein